MVWMNSEDLCKSKEEHVSPMTFTKEEAKAAMESNPLKKANYYLKTTKNYKTLDDLREFLSEEVGYTNDSQGRSYGACDDTLIEMCHFFMTKDSDAAV